MNLLSWCKHFLLIIQEIRKPNINLKHRVFKWLYSLNVIPKKSLVSFHPHMQLSPTYAIISNQVNLFWHPWWSDSSKTYHFLCGSNNKQPDFWHIVFFQRLMARALHHLQTQCFPRSRKTLTQRGLFLRNIYISALCHTAKFEAP